MKKLLLVVFSILAVIIMVLSSCSSSPTATSATTAATRPQTSSATYTQKPQTTAAPSAPGTHSPSATKTMTATTTAYPHPTPVPSPTSPIHPSSSGSGGGSASRPESDALGFSTGGAKDIANFRENIRNNYLPLPTDVTYEGLFYDYYFDTGSSGPSEKLFSPSYSFAVTRDPLSNKTEYYLSVGLNSGLKESDFERKKLNLVIVMDNSGSMGEQYNQYYYDDFGKQTDAWAEEGGVRRTKMESSIESVLNILDQLNDDDQFSIVLFNSRSYLLEPMSPVDWADMRDVEDRIRDITPGGSTNLDAGLELATKQFRGLEEADSYEYENRIIVLTDAQPNTGDYSLSGLTNVAESNADNRIFTTVIGIGVDFNTQLVEQITKIKGANYYSVHSPRQFRQRIAEEFDYMVTPLVFDVTLNFESRGWRIEKVFGSPEADESTGRLMTINTLFPSKSVDGETRGGLVLLKLRKISSSSEEPVYLKTTYEDRNGRVDGSKAVIDLEARSPEYFENDGIRKGVLLVRYASLMKNWMLDQRQHVRYNQPWEPCINEDTGLVVPDESYPGQWERTSQPLTVSHSYNRIFDDFRDYFADEAHDLDDEDLEQELDILNFLMKF
jgi:Ca-activated chloride channel homolog